MAASQNSSVVARGSLHDRQQVTRASQLNRRAQRSRVTNGHDLLPDIDGRSAIARRYRDIVSAIMVDQGGADRCSESRQQLVRRFAAAAVLAEQMESRLARGEQIDISQHALLCSSLVRLAQRIGINRVPRVVTDIADYVAIDKVESTSVEADE
jgi:hypothetical protein